MLEPMEYGDEMTPEIRKACFEELARRKYITAEVVYSGGHDEGGVDEIYATDELTQGEIPLTEEDPLFNCLASVVYATFGGFGSVPDTSGKFIFTTETGKIVLEGERTVTEGFEEEIK